MFILAGKQKLAEERATTLVSLREKAQTSGLAETRRRRMTLKTNAAL